MNSRRRLIRYLLQILLARFAYRLSPADASTLVATPQDAEGPYYPKNWSGEIDNDLIALSNQSYANGTLMHLSGRVLSANGSPIAGAIVEIWQTDETGEYRHPRSGGEAVASRGFQGYGRARTDSLGCYAFRTIKPVTYSGRPPHVHFKVVSAKHVDLVTQMYFAGDNIERNLLFRWFGGFASERERLTVSPETRTVAERDQLVANFDLVLEGRGSS